MAIAKHAVVLRSERVAPHTVVLELQADAPLGFAGGQYVIIDSGLSLPSGKAVKRAYSLLSRDSEQQRLEFAVMQLPEGPGSGYMHALRPGARIVFSGPWGKLYLPQDAPPAATLIVATDTGITAALGLLRSSRMTASLARTELVWLHAEGDDFLPHEFVRARLPAGFSRLRIETLPAVNDPQRVPFVRARVAAALAEHAPQRVFVTGDGAVNYALLDDLRAAGIECTRDNLESFFNMPKKSPPPPAQAPGVSESA